MKVTKVDFALKNWVDEKLALFGRLSSSADVSHLKVVCASNGVVFFDVHARSAGRL